MSEKVLIVFAHPTFAKSRSNRALLAEAAKNPNITIHSLYEKYPDFKIDIAAEQKLLLEHDAYILQFPFYWYSSPALLKEWLDTVLAYGFAFGKTPGEGKLKGKACSLTVTAGSAFDDYLSSGKYRTTVEELIRPFQLTAEFCGMNFKKPFVIHGIRPAAQGGPTEEELAKKASEYHQFIEKLVKG